MGYNKEQDGFVLWMTGLSGAGKTTIALELIEKLEEHRWKISNTAEAIGVERSNLHRKLRNFGIDLKRLKI